MLRCTAMLTAVQAFCLLTRMTLRSCSNESTHCRPSRFHTGFEGCVFEVAGVKTTPCWA